MIVFDLKCDEGHVFEAWFGSSSAYEDQKASGLLECPSCGSRSVTKAVMAPNVGRKGNQKIEQSPSSVQAKTAGKPQTGAGAVKSERHQSVAVPPAVDPVVAEKVTMLLQEFRTAVEASCDNVGKDFAEEARKIHYGEAEERGIYGESTAEETRELLEEGIDILPMPMPRRTDA
ncbi:hypothetical protein GCM10017044_00230 [Kordiimonas sediminis]|uniref:DUF1178 family protein n=1 Tax=Kordiimonas sediminis TaxID=1735581 RepID=A0A919AIL6_9PROT|nr:DUF1178 family protein [Kordiimonas sediminis]GHF10500.1 hypothetical protein GCM10017044_00230 [Kordiimonas sediminis]